MILIAVTGVGTCELCLCDLDGNQQLNATDALADLRLVVGLSAPRNCPPAAPSALPSTTTATSAAPASP
jgi:hypothetical protein